MFGIGLPELIVMTVVLGIPLGIIILIIFISNSRSKRRLKQLKEVIMSYCTKCGKEIAEGSSFCRNCGEKLPNVQSDIQGAPVSSAITEQDYTSFIGGNADKYLTKFKKFNIDGTDSFSATWHWPAFFVPFFWMLYRKLYLWALLVFVLSIIPLVTFPLMIFFGITGNYIYYKHTKKKLLQIKLAPSSSDIQRAVNIAHQGGVNNAVVIVAPILLIAVVGILAAIAIPQFNAMKTRGYCISAKSESQNAYTASQAYFLDHPKGEINNVDDLKDHGFQKSDKVLVHVQGTVNSLLISAKHPGCDKTYFSDQTGNVKEEVGP
ncbi:MAG: hypothetical protein C0399_03255 [Syntrophus sp. (in: bacteria)]|nr:hypothetical protein [Syntrophus sp. (in: bacteria)]